MPDDNQALKKLIDAFVLRLGSLQGRSAELLAVHSSYSQRAHHHHNLVWVAPAAVLAASITSLAVARDLHGAAYAPGALMLACMLYFANRIADGNRRQWRLYLAACNAIEIHWGMRLPGDQLDPLIGRVEGMGMGQTARRMLMRLAMLTCIAAAVAKALQAYFA